MSTKCTLAYNFHDDPPDDPTCPEFHLYSECLEEDGAVYLEMPGAVFEASNIGVTVKIPVKVWNQIIKIGTIHE